MGKRPRPPNPRQVASEQQSYNWQSLLQEMRANQMNQQTPWGSTSYTGEVGSPDRTQHVELNPEDQARLDQQRKVQSRLLALVMGGG